MYLHSRFGCILLYVFLPTHEIRAVNVHLIKSIPFDQENLVLAHQVRSLAMLFDLFVEDSNSSVKKGGKTSVIDVGLCKPANGGLVARSLRVEGK